MHISALNSIPKGPGDVVSHFYKIIFRDHIQINNVDLLLCQPFGILWRTPNINGIDQSTFPTIRKDHAFQRVLYLTIRW